MSYPILRVNNLSKEFLVLQDRRQMLFILQKILLNSFVKKSRVVLKDVSFTVNLNENLAIIGSNGAGKTTLLKIIASIYKATAGSFEVNGVIQALFGHRHIYFERLIVKDNIYLIGAFFGCSKQEICAHLDFILDRANLLEFKFAYMNNLSNGQKQRLVLSVLLYARADLLIFDESCDFVDSVFFTRFQEMLKEKSKNSTIIMASHNKKIIENICSKALWLDNGCVRMYGEFNNVMSSYEKHNLVK